MRRKRIIAVMMAVMIGGSLTACGGNADSVQDSNAVGTGAEDTSAAENAAEENPVSEEASIDADGKKSVVIWDYFETDGQKEMMQILIDGFNQSQDEYVVSHEYMPSTDYIKQLTLGIASGELPDVVIVDGCDMASFIEMDLFGDISDMEVDWDAYIAGPMSSSMKDGKHYGLPFATNDTALFYNKDIFDAAGIDYPDENTTWEEFHEMAKKLTESGTTGFGNAAVASGEGCFQCLPWIYTAGGSYLDIEGGVEAYELMEAMVEVGSWSKECVNWTQSDVNNYFMAGNIAMQQNGPWQIPVIEQNAPDLNYGVTVLPKFDENSGQATSMLGGENMGAVKKENMDGAKAFLKYYDQTEVMVEAMKLYGSFPPKSEASQDSYWMDDPVQKEFIRQLDTSIPRGPSAIWPTYSNAIVPGFQKALTLDAEATDIAKEIQAAVDTIE